MMMLYKLSASMEFAYVVLGSVLFSNKGDKGIVMHLWEDFAESKMMDIMHYGLET